MACKPRCINIIFGGRVWHACLRVLATSRLRCCVAVPVVSLACIGTKSSEYHAQPPQDDFESPEMALGVRVCKSSDDFESPEMALGALTDPNALDSLWQTFAARRKDSPILM